MKKNLLFIITFIIIFTNLIGARALMQDGEYNVKVSLWKKYEDSKSMGNNALTTNAVLTIKDGRSKLKVKFVPLETMGFVGYLGELLVEGKPVEILSKYENFDEYNDPKNGSDEKMKGIPYPKEMEFNFDPTKEFTDVTVYVPVMGSMGFGTQDARLRLAKEDLEKFTGGSKDTSTAKGIKSHDLKVEENAEVSLEDGLYSVPIKLWHSVEDKASMGNGAMVQVAEIEVKDKKAFLYVGSDKMEVSNIVASLVSLYYEAEDGDYYASEANCYDIEVPNEVQKRPRVFKMPLRFLNKYINVMVDPKVEPMGDEPIKARLQLDVDKVIRLEPTSSTLLKQFNEGEKKPVFDSTKGGSRQNKAIWITYTENTFKRDFSFYGNKVMGEKADLIKKQFEALDTVFIYNIEFLGSLDKVEKAQSSPQLTRERIEPDKPIKVEVPLLSLKSSDNIKLYKIQGDAKKELKFEKKEKTIVFEADSSGDYALVKKSAVVSAAVNGSKGVEDRANSFMNKVKKPSVKVVSTNTTIPTPTAPATPVSQPQQILESVKPSIPKEEPVVNGEVKTLKPRENKGIIILITITIVAINVLSIFFIKRNLKKIMEELIENKDLKNWRGAHEKTN